MGKVTPAHEKVRIGGFCVENHMPSIRLSLLVLRSQDMEKTRDCYTCVGIDFQREQHGKRPPHFAAQIDSLVFEIYPNNSDDPNLEQVRLGFEVPDLSLTCHRLKLSLYAILKEPSITPWGTRAIARDPDGRSVELYQKISMKMDEENG